MGNEKVVLPPKNQAIKNIINNDYEGNISAFCRAIDIKDSQKICRLFKKDKRSDKYPVPSTDILEQISNKLGISIDELLGVHQTNVYGDNLYSGTINKNIDKELVSQFLTEIAEQRKVAQKAQEHVDKLIDLLNAFKK